MASELCLIALRCQRVRYVLRNSESLEKGRLIALVVEARLGWTEDHSSHCIAWIRYPQTPVPDGSGCGCEIWPRRLVGSANENHVAGSFQGLDQRCIRVWKRRFRIPWCKRVQRYVEEDDLGMKAR